MQRFAYIGMAKDGTINEFTLFAEVLSRTEDTVTYKRYQNFGKVIYRKPVTVPVKEFEDYYQPLTDALYEKCLDTMKSDPKLYGGLING